MDVKGCGIVVLIYISLKIDEVRDFFPCLLAMGFLSVKGHLGDLACVSHSTQPLPLDLLLSAAPVVSLFGHTSRKIWCHCPFISSPGAFSSLKRLQICVVWPL